MPVVDFKNLIRQQHLQQKIIQRLNWKVKTSARFSQPNLFAADFPPSISIKPQFNGSFYLQRLWAYLHLSKED